MSNKTGKEEIPENYQVSQLGLWENNYGHIDNGGQSATPVVVEQQAEVRTPTHRQVLQQPVSEPTSPISSSSTGCRSPTEALPVAIEGAAVTAEPNWQASRATLRERNVAMLSNELMADVHFTVGPPGASQRIPAHRYVLATGSSVFYAMFFGGLADKSEINVPDVDPVAFLVMLRYLYSDDVLLEADTVLATLYVAKKYIVPNLARACVTFLETSLTASNACLLLSQSRLFEEPELMQRCWEIIDAQATVSLSSEGFSEIDHSTLCSVLARETLKCREVDVFRAAINWARDECRRQELPDPGPDQLREVLGEALFMVRVAAMDLEEFADNVAQSGVLTLQETTDVFLHFTASLKPAIRFPVKPRLGLKAQICHRFQSSAYRGNQWRYRGRCDSIQFSVDRRIFLVGFGLYGSSNGAAEYVVRMELKRLGRKLADNTTRFFCDGSSNTFHVLFTHPIQVEPDTFYTASAVLDGAELSYFGQEGMSEVVAGRVTFQYQCSSDSTNGTGVQGGQIPELMFYGPATDDNAAAADG